LREARLAKGLTQAQLGAVLGLDEENSAAPRVSRYERGDRVPDPATMEKLAQALGMPVAYFHATNDLVAETLLVMSRLEPEQQRELLTKVRDYAQSRGVDIDPPE